MRADALLAELGLARSRTHARALIEAGVVTADGAELRKPSQPIPAGSTLAVHGGDHYVSRAAHKLEAAFVSFPTLQAEGKHCLDVGASTGGFSQVLLLHGAKHVIALDVGHDQLSPQLANEQRLTLVEGCNARELTRENLAERSGHSQPPQLVVADLSFISLRTVLPALRATAADTAEFVLLIKPQFEVGRARVKAGIVTSSADREWAIHAVIAAAAEVQLTLAGIIASPIVGAAGNQEYLAWFQPSPAGVGAGVGVGVGVGAGVGVGEGAGVGAGAREAAPVIDAFQAENIRTLAQNGPTQ